MPNPRPAANVGKRHRDLILNWALLRGLDKMRGGCPDRVRQPPKSPANLGGNGVRLAGHLGQRGEVSVLKIIGGDCGGTWTQLRRNCGNRS